MPPENWARRKITNSAGFTGAIPTSTTRRPWSIDSGGFVSASWHDLPALLGLFGEAEGMTYDEISAAGIAFNYRNRDEPVAPGGSLPWEAPPAGAGGHHRRRL